MNDTKHCPRCGKELPTGALQGLCPACLLREGVAADTATQPESPPPEVLPLEEVSRLFPQLDLIALLGQGGMGAVYQARQPALDRLVALKILPRQTAAGEPFAERFSREARALARLSHPNIVAVHDFGQTEGVPWFIMEFVDGVNLRQLQRAGRLSPRQALELVPQICDALQYAHDQGVVHRDIKPENVLVDRRGRVKIADFGLARLVDAAPDDVRLTGEAQVMGTPHYMAPEQIEHPLEVDHRADIYALGVVFYELLTGELPLGKFPPPSRKVRVDVRLDEVVLRSLEKEPDRRYQQAGEVGTAVKSIASTTAPAAQTGGAAPPPRTAGVPRDALSGPRKAALWYGFGVSVLGLPLGLAMNLPLVWGLSIAGILIGSFKLGFWPRRWLENWPARDGAQPGRARESGTPRSKDTSGSDRMPRVLWPAFLVLGIAFMAKLMLRPFEPWVFADLVLLLALACRLKAAWVATLVFAVLGTAAVVAGSPVRVGLGVLALNGLVVVSVWLSAGWFFPGPAETLPARLRDAGRGVLFLLPPMGFTAALLGNVLDLDIDAQFYAAMIGLPAATGLGALLVWISTQSHADSRRATRGMRWSGKAIGAAVLLGLDLPLVATAFLILRAIAADPDWKPATGEAVFTFLVLGVGLLLALGSLALGWVARKETAGPNAQRRGDWLAWAGVWFWPALLVAALLVQVKRIETTPPLSSERARQAEALLETAIIEHALDLGWSLDDVRVEIRTLPSSVSCYLGQGVRRDGKIPAPFAAAARITPGAPGRWQVRGQGELAAMRFWIELPRPGTTPPPARLNRGFGPTRTAVLSTAVATQLKDCFLDLDTGRVLSAPTELVRALRAKGQLTVFGAVPLFDQPLLGWLRSNHVDLAFQPGLEGATLLDGTGVVTAPRLDGWTPFDSQSAGNIRALSANLSELLQIHGARKPEEPVMSRLTRSAGGNTWLFRCLDGKAGVLEISDVRDEGRELWVRWKLLEKPGEDLSLPEMSGGP